MQAKGPSSDALESECRAEQSYLDVFDNSSLSDEWIDVVGTGQLLCKVFYYVYIFKNCRYF